jgi:hypothetical protein
MAVLSSSSSLVLPAVWHRTFLSESFHLDKAFVAGRAKPQILSRKSEEWCAFKL